MRRTAVFTALVLLAAAAGFADVNRDLGARFLVDARIGEISLMVLSDKRPPSDSMLLHIEPKDIHVFDKDEIDLPSDIGRNFL